MLNLTRKMVKYFKMQGLVIAMLKYVAKYKKVWIVKRDGIFFEIDLTKTIDFGIFMGGWENSTLDFLKKTLKPGDVVIEVGANIGAHTLLMAKLVGVNGCVIAIEPTQYGRRKLSRNIALNPDLKNIRIISSVISSEKIEMPSLSINPSWSLSGDKEPEILYKPMISTVDSIYDDQKLSRVDLLKVDVDGYDFKVLQGSCGVLENNKPMVFCELCEYSLNENGASLNDLFDLMSNYGYVCKHEDDGSLLDATTVKRLVKLEKSINGIFIPQQ
jgi:FkbM family methyltransferase